jgi:hypothetical protein
VKGKKTGSMKTVSKKKLSLLNIITIENENMNAQYLQIKKNSDLYSTIS